MNVLSPFYRQRGGLINESFLQTILFSGSQEGNRSVRINQKCRLEGLADRLSASEAISSRLAMRTTVSSKEREV